MATQKELPGDWDARLYFFVRLFLLESCEIGTRYKKPIALRSTEVVYLDNNNGVFSIGLKKFHSKGP